MDVNSPPISFRDEIKKVWPLIFIQAAFAMAFSGLMLNMLTLSEIIWQDGTFHAFEMSLVIGVQNIGVAIVGLIFGRWVDRHNRKNLLIISLTIAAIGRGMLGFTPEGHQFAYPFFLLGNLVAGIGRGGFSPLMVSLSNDYLNTEMRSRFFGLIESIGQIFNIFGMIVSTLWIQWGLWQWYFWGAGLIVLVGVIAIILYLHEPKRGSQSQKDLAHLLKTTQYVYKYQLNQKTIRETVFSRTNIIAFIEGIFTWLILANVIYMVYPYIQSPPYNVSAFMTSIIMSLFGVPGAIFGAILFGRISDHLGAKNIINRVNLIIFSIISLLTVSLLIFWIPLPSLNALQGNNIRILFSYPSVWILATLIFIMRAVIGIYNINQNPILQAINLPEAQGTVTSWGQFLETLAMGLGPALAGFILEKNGGNYANASMIVLLIGVFGPILWIFARKSVKNDVNRVQTILKDRSKEINEKM